MKDRMNKIKFLFVFITIYILNNIHGSIINIDVKRHIDLSKHIVRVRNEIIIKNEKKDINEYLLVFSNIQHIHISYIKSIFNEQTCEAEKIESIDPEVQTYKVKFQTPILKNKEGLIKVIYYITRVLTPFPKEITQSEKQQVIYKDSHLFISPYLTKNQVTTVKLPLSKLRSFSQPLQPVTRKQNTIIYGPYESISSTLSLNPSSFLSLSVHYPMTKNIFTLTNVVKEVELSMWGKVSIEELIDMENSGATLKNGFSRLDYEHGSRANVMTSVEATIPKNVMNIYYRDQIGNISTSQIRNQRNTKKLILTPRFPMFGGWKTHFYMGFLIPVETVLTRKNNLFTLVFDFSTSISDAVVDNYKLKVILPEGSKNIHVNTKSLPMTSNNNLDIQDKTKRLTYLDTSKVGRPVITVTSKNLINKHNIPIEINFDFDRNSMFLEPLLLVGGFFTFFILCMIFFRLDVSLSSHTEVSKRKNKKKEADNVKLKST